MTLNLYTCMAKRKEEILTKVEKKEHSQNKIT